MTPTRLAFILPLATLAALLGCGEGTPDTTGSGGSGATSSGTTSSASATSTTSTTSTGTTTTTKPSYEPSGFSCSGASPSLANDIVPTLAAPSCASMTGCHVALKTASGVVDQLVNRLAQQCTDGRLMIDPGHPEASYVIHKMTNHNICTGQTMPKDAPMLADAEIQLIYDWICNGAPNN